MLTRAQIEEALKQNRKQQLWSWDPIATKWVPCSKHEERDGYTFYAITPNRSVKPERPHYHLEVAYKLNSNLVVWWWDESEWERTTMPAWQPDFFYEITSGSKPIWIPDAKYRSESKHLAASRVEPQS